MDKQLFIDELIELLQADIEEHIRAAQEAHEAATHEQSKAETQYDTLGLEQAYLAHGQSERIDALQQSIARLHHFECRSFDIDDEVYLGALVTLQSSHSEQKLNVWLLPCAGGYCLQDDIHTLTPDTPLAKAMIGLGVGDEFSLANGQGYRITEVS